MQARTARWIAWVLLGLDLLLTTVGLVLVVVNRRTELPPFVSSVVSDAGLLIAFLPFGVVGALIFSRRSGNRIGLIFLFTGLTMALSLTAFEYAIYAGLTNPGSLPGVDWALRVSAWVSITPFLAYMFLFLLFPDGHFVSRRWLPVAGLAVVAAGWLEANTIRPSIPFVPARWLAIAAMTLCALAPLVRYRRASSDERQQIKWFAVAAFPAVAFLMPGLFTNPSGWYFVLFVVAQAAVPFAAGIAILKYRLYDIDVVINKAVVYGALAAFITVVYVGDRGGRRGAASGPTEGPLLSVVATAIVAVAFQPVPARAQRLANRLVYGKRATPYEVLSEFSERMAQAYCAARSVLPRMARIVGEGTGAARATCGCGPGRAASREASPEATDRRPDRAPLGDGELAAFPDGDAAVPVRHQGELLGALRADAARRPFAAHGASCWPTWPRRPGWCCATSALIERAAGVAAAHGGRPGRASAASWSATCTMARSSSWWPWRSSCGWPSARRDRTRQRPRRCWTSCRRETTEALDNLRDLARGIYPPLLADQGLAVALASQARKARRPRRRSRPTASAATPQEVEAAVYFCCLEALQNIAKYADATGAVVKLEATDGFLAFEVTDDGVGFDRHHATRAGTTNMADRLEALGGVLDVRSSPGRGDRRLRAHPDRGRRLVCRARPRRSLGGTARARADSACVGGHLRGGVSPAAIGSTSPARRGADQAGLVRQDHGLDAVAQAELAQHGSTRGSSRWPRDTNSARRSRRWTARRASSRSTSSSRSVRLASAGGRRLGAPGATARTGRAAAG